MGRQAIDLTGKRTGRITVIGKSKVRNKYGKPLWDCICDCGNRKEYPSGQILRGMKSCGCSRTKHGKTNTAEYKAWQSIKDRILRNFNPNYSGRGIGMCPQWLDFETFLADMGLRPSVHHSIDRIDNSIGYFPGNCRWAEPQLQQRNKRNSHMLSVGGKTKHLIEWCEELSLNVMTVYKRLENGWSNEDVLKPVRKYDKLEQQT